MVVPQSHRPRARTVADRPTADKLGPAGARPPRPRMSAVNASIGRREPKEFRLAPEAGHNELGTAGGWMRPWRSWAAT